MILRIAVHFAGFRRHLADHFPNKQREFRLLRRDVFT